jgi:hypothetical protein
MAGFYGHDNEPSGSVEGEELLHKLRDYDLLHLF